MLRSIMAPSLHSGSESWVKAELITILWAEDDPVYRFALEAAIEGTLLEQQITWADDGQHALDILSSAIPDLIFLDLNMPKVSGMEVLLHIKQHPRLRAIPVVILTTSSTSEAAAYLGGASSYHVKPKDLEGLTELLALCGQYWIGAVKLPGPPAAPGPATRALRSVKIKGT